LHIKYNASKRVKTPLYSCHLAGYCQDGKEMLWEGEYIANIEGIPTAYFLFALCRPYVRHFPDPMLWRGFHLLYQPSSHSFPADLQTRIPFSNISCLWSGQFGIGNNTNSVHSPVKVLSLGLESVCYLNKLSISWHAYSPYCSSQYSAHHRSAISFVIDTDSGHSKDAPYIAFTHYTKQQTVKGWKDAVIRVVPRFISGAVRAKGGDYCSLIVHGRTEEVFIHQTTSDYLIGAM
jgi:hypothetical protein